MLLVDKITHHKSRGYHQDVNYKIVMQAYDFQNKTL